MTEEHLRRLNPSQSIVNFTYVNEDVMKQFKSYLNKTQFQGLTVSTKHSWILFLLSRSSIMDRCTKFWRKIEIPGGDFCYPRQSKRQHLTLHAVFISRDRCNLHPKEIAWVTWRLSSYKVRERIKAIIFALIFYVIVCNYLIDIQPIECMTVCNDNKVQNQPPLYWQPRNTIKWLFSHQFPCARGTCLVRSGTLLWVTCHQCVFREEDL